MCQPAANPIDPTIALEIPIAKTSIIDYDVRIDGYEMVISYEEHSDFITYPQRDRKEAERLIYTDILSVTIRLICVISVQFGITHYLWRAFP